MSATRSMRSYDASSVASVPSPLLNSCRLSTCYNTSSMWVTDMDVPNNFKPYLCKLDNNDCVSLVHIIKSFNTPVSEEHAWALCYQCAKCFKNAFEHDPNRCRVVKNLEEVRIHKDGFIHPSTILNTEEISMY